MSSRYFFSLFVQGKRISELERLLKVANETKGNAYRNGQADHDGAIEALKRELHAQANKFKGEGQQQLRYFTASITKKVDKNCRSIVCYYIYKHGHL